ncbi:MAG TPA: inositol monophosphatase [Dehalococcoidia bacterium]|nr:inositol monophosphatase [Dehalococcoidia bacterium]
MAQETSPDGVVCGPEPADSSLFREIEACAGKWAIAAGERLSARAREALHVEYKGGSRSNPVSEADREAEEFLFRQVTHHFPDHSMIGEEGRDPGPDGAPIVWVIDPLDGTSNYLNGQAMWSVSIGVLWYGVPVAGAIFAPLGVAGEPALFSARKGGGARLNGRPIAVDAAAELRSSRLACLPEVYQGEIERRREARGRPEVRTLGSIALELALTACGALQFSAFWIPRIWDVAAGVSLILEAGGCVMQRQERERPWQPLRAFEAPLGRPLRKWQGAIIAANEPLAVDLTERVKAGREPFAPRPASA